MVNQELIEYIRKEEVQGYSPQQLRQYLIGKGFSAKDVDEALRSANQNSLTNQPINATRVNGTANIKDRNVFLVVLFTFITFGIYQIFWLVFTTNELRANTKSAPNPYLLLLFFIPIVNIFVIFYYLWKYSKAIEELNGMSAVLLFVLWIVFPLIGIIISQLELNKKA